MLHDTPMDIHLGNPEFLGCFGFAGVVTEPFVALVTLEYRS
jgi:hypothetical protein